MPKEVKKTEVLSEKKEKEDLLENQKSESKSEKKSLFSSLKKFSFSSVLNRIKEAKIESDNDLDNLSLLETDLIKGEVQIKFEWSKHLIAFFALLLSSFVLIMEAYILLSWWEKDKSLENSYYLQDEILEINREKNNLEQRYSEVFDFKNRMSTSFSLLDKHVYWTNFFSFLEQNTLKNVYFKKFSGDTGGNYILPAASDDVRAISYQSKYFSADRRSISVSISDEEIAEGGIGPESGFVNFNVNLSVDPKIFNQF